MSVYPCEEYAEERNKQIKVYLVNCENALLFEIGRKEFKQKDIIFTYAMSILAEYENDEKIDWGIINKAIIERWSQSSLNRIKIKAWKHLETDFSEFKR